MHVQHEPCYGPCTPLHLAALGGPYRSGLDPPLDYLEIMDALLTHGADPYACHSDEVRARLLA